LTPGVPLLALVAGQVAELLAAHREQRAEDADLALLLPFEHSLQCGAGRECPLAGAAATAERPDPDLGVEQQVARDALLGRTSVQAEHLPVAAHEAVLAVARDAPECRPALRLDDQPRVDGKPANFVAEGHLALVEVAQLVAADGEVG